MLHARRRIGGSPTLDLLPVFVEWESRHPQERLTRRDFHRTPAAHRVAAGALGLFL